MSQRLSSDNPQTEIGANESATYWQQAIEYAPVGMAIFDPQMRYLTVSRQWLEDYNLSHDIIGRSHYEIFPDISLEWRQIHQECLAGGIAQRHEDLYPREDGSIAWVSWCIRPWYTPTGAIGGIMMFSENITQRKQAQLELQQREEQFRLTFEQAAIGICHVSLDGRWLLVNQSFCEIVGYEREELLALTFQDITHPDDLETDLDLIEQVLTGIVTRVSIEKRYIHKNGSIIWVSLSVSLLRQASGEPVYFISTIQDIGDRKQAQIALQQSEERYRSLIAATSQIVWIADAEGQTPDIPSMRAYTGQTESEIAGFGWLDAIHPEDRAKTAQAWTQALETKSFYEVEYRIRGADGNYRYFQGKSVPMLTADGNIREWMGTCTDIHDRKQAEIALKESEERYRALIEASSQIVWTSPADGIPIDDNPAWRELTGQTWEELKIWGWLEVIHPSDRQFMVETTQTAAKTGTPYQAEFRVRRHDGEYRHMLTRGVPLLAADGSVRQWIGTCSDIHDRKQAELALQKSEERFRSLIEATSQIIWSTDAEGAFITDQPQWRAYTGQTVEELSGWGWLNKIHPEDQAPTTKVWLAALTNRTVYEAELRIQRYDGEYRYFSARGVPILDTDGSIQEWVGTNSDITERKQAEQALRQTLEILDSASDSIIIRDMDDRIAYWNRGAEILYGWKREEVIGKYIHTFLQSVFPKPLNTVLSEFLQQGHWEGELHHTTCDGRHIIVASRWTLQRDASGQPCTQLEINNDITERKQFEFALAKAKEAAEAASYAKSEFLANMSHELRTPLNGILGYAQILQRSKHLHEEARSRIDVIYQCGSHLLTLINDILDLSKIEAQKVELMPTDFHFPAFLQGVAEMCRIRAELKNIHFQYQLASELPIGIHTDEKRLRQVLINLLSNAIKFTDAGSVTFTISYGCEEKIRFEVRDTGIGIPQDKLQAIFQPFEQAGDSRRQTEGTGLGLAISQRIVELMGSTIHVQSEIGVGSIFWFDVNLPTADEWAKTSQADDKGQIIGIKDRHPKILVVDDKWANRSVIANLLSPIGFEIAEAVNGEEGWQKIAEFQPDLVITDLLMPELDGFGLIKRIRASETFKNIAIIVSSASVFETDQHRSLEVGGDEFIPKPIQAIDLFCKLRKHLNLEWIYDEQKPLNQPERENNQLIAPSPAELEILYELVMKGNFKGINKQAQLFAQIDEKYIPFANKLNQLAKGFQDQEILELIQSYKSKL
jgi:PAS domain S-box-containing protein